MQGVEERELVADGGAFVGGDDDAEVGGECLLSLGEGLGELIEGDRLVVEFERAVGFECEECEAALCFGCGGVCGGEGDVCDLDGDGEDECEDEEGEEEEDDVDEGHELDAWFDGGAAEAFHMGVSVEGWGGMVGA